MPEWKLMDQTATNTSMQQALGGALNEETEMWQFFERPYAQQCAAGATRTDEELDANIAERQRDAEEYERWLEELRADPCIHSTANNPRRINSSTVL